MKTKTTQYLLFLSTLALLMVAIACSGMVAIACGGEPDATQPTPSDPKLELDKRVEIPSDKQPNASVSGTITYRERVALTSGAKLVVELRDVSRMDVVAPLIASQTINNPGQVPIEFKVDYNRQDIEPMNTYAISATIFEADGRMAFTNDTAYDVITYGNPETVEMLLVFVEPITTPETN